MELDDDEGVFISTGGVKAKKTQEELLSFNQIKYLYPNLLGSSVNTEFKD